jgi:hypothetical protein
MALRYVLKQVSQAIYLLRLLMRPLVTTLSP